MRAFEFETSVRVIILTEDRDENQRDELEYLMDNPLKVKKVKPLTREEVYER